MFGNLLKAVVGVVVLPVATAIDVVMLPSSAFDLRKGPFDRTDRIAKSIARNVDEALKP